MCAWVEECGCGERNAVQLRRGEVRQDRPGRYTAEDEPRTVDQCVVLLVGQQLHVADLDDRVDGGGCGHSATVVECPLRVKTPDPAVWTTSSSAEGCGRSVTAGAGGTECSLDEKRPRRRHGRMGLVGPGAHSTRSRRARVRSFGALHLTSAEEADDDEGLGHVVGDDDDERGP